MKRFRLALVILLVLCFLPIAAPDAAAGYSDVPQGHWAAGEIQRAAELELFQGVEEGVFGLGQPITRAALATALTRLFHWETELPEAPSFRDVLPESWYYAAVETALAQGAIAYTGEAFCPDNPITREELAAMLIRSLGYTALAGVASEYECPFTDVTTNQGFITVMYDLGIATGTGAARFSPDIPATREQAAAMLVRVYDKLHGASQRVTPSGETLIRLPTPPAEAGQAIPITPLEPIAELYDALRTWKRQGTGEAALCLTGGGIQTLNGENGKFISTPLTAQEVEAILTKEGTRDYYSDRYESSYCIYTTDNLQTATVWYQSRRSQEAKLRLARLFGVTKYTLST